MFITGIKDAFNANHYLFGEFGEESREHTHPYTVEWTVAKNTLDTNGFSVDISILREILHGLLQELEGRLLNDIPFFKDRQPSVENTALYIFAGLRGRLKHYSIDPETFTFMEVKIWEFDDAWASYRSP
jgi:6-pyruvoyltetrahydropterin/6-carboxytetrahydropterin synthase